MIKIKINSKLKEDDETTKRNIDKFKSAQVRGYDVVSNSKRSNEIIKAFEKIDILPRTNEDYEKIIKNIRPLQTSEMVRPIAFGTKGEIYKLSNGNVLKIFTSGYSDDVAWYDWIIKKLHSGEGSKHILNIYDHGSFMYGSKKVFFMEMEELIVFSDFIKSTGRSKTGAHSDINNLFDYFGEDYDKNRPWEQLREEIKNRFNEKYINDNVKQTITSQEINQILELFKHTVSSGLEINDFHPGNFGFRPNDNKANPTFVIFDR